MVKILLERYPEFDIFWYHWPTDGWVLPVQDFEPIAILYSRDKICSVIVRSGWEFVTTPNDTNQIPMPVRILCDPMFHHPTVITSSRIYNAIRVLPRVFAKTIAINAQDITPQFRIGLGHPTNRSHGLFQDPKDYVRKIHDEFC